MIDINKKYRTRDGREVSMLHRVPDGFPTKYPWRGVVSDYEHSWTDKGEHFKDGTDPRDIIDVREPREWWINEYPPEAAPTYPAFYPTEEAAARQAASGVIGQIRVREVIEP